MYKYYSKIVIDMETLCVIGRVVHDYSGPWALCLGTVKSMFSGATSEDKALAKSQNQFMETLQNEQNTQFANEQEAQKAIQAAWAPILKGGAYQYGFSSAEDQNLISQIESGGATATENAVTAQQLREQQMSGGADVLPSGAQAAIEAQQRELGAQNTATNLLKEKELGYQVGRENFAKATDAERAVAELSNPTGYAGAATEAAKGAETAQQQVDKMNANSLTAKLLGGAIGGGIGFLTGGPKGALKGLQIGSGIAGNQGSQGK